MIIDKENNNIFIVEKLNSLKNTLDRDKLNLNEIKRKLDGISEYSNYNMYEYLNALLDPIKNKGGKIPENMPIPTCSFQLHNTLDFSPTVNGYDTLFFNPWFLASDDFKDKPIKFGETTFYLLGNVGMYFFCNQDASLSSGTPDPRWYYPRGFAQNIPSVYDKYRLVSACVEVRYTGRLDEAKGVIGGGINYMKSNYLGFRLGNAPGGDPSWGSANPDCAEYTNTELIRDSYYSQENLVLEGIRMLYYPLDNSFNEFKKVWDGSNFNAKTKTFYSQSGLLIGEIDESFFKSGFNWFVYGIGLPTSESRNFKVDYYLNFECIPKAEFLNYLPITVNVLMLDKHMLNKFIEEVKKKSITKVKSFNLINNI